MTLTGSPDVRVAVIGSGLAGLATAYYLAQTPPDKGRCVHVDLFERQPKLGMDAESISVERDGKEVRVDVPMRSFSEGKRIGLTQVIIRSSLHCTARWASSFARRASPFPFLLALTRPRRRSGNMGRTLFFCTMDGDSNAKSIYTHRLPA